ncbi:MAG: hypothetical protein O2925_12260, partial [Actinomycetota bacterium]|nr:hypothetical protein [Actinomycetota bacterium]
MMKKLFPKLAKSDSQRSAKFAVGALLSLSFAAFGISITSGPVLSASSCPDVQTWTSRTSALSMSDLGMWMSVTWGGPAGNEKFVAFSAGNFFGSDVLTSPDGVTWTGGASGGNNGFTSVTWGGPAGNEMFVAVAQAGTGDRVM